MSRNNVDSTFIVKLKVYHISVFCLFNYFNFHFVKYFSYLVLRSYHVVFRDVCGKLTFAPHIANT